MPLLWDGGKRPDDDGPDGAYYFVVLVLAFVAVVVIGMMFRVAPADTGLIDEPVPAEWGRPG